MRWLVIPLLFAATPASAQLGPVAQGPAPVIRLPAPALPAPTLTVWNPAADYITAGQDEQGYRFWYGASPYRAMQVRSFNAYLTEYGVGGIVPTWQLLRTATSWHRCGDQPFEVPPTSEWPHVVQTLRYINDYVVPAIGPVEPVSGYRNPHLNACAGGAPESAHKHYSAIDLVPLRPTRREDLMRTLCAVHGRRGTDYQVGLGFYAFLRFHVDTTKYRRWGADPATSRCPPLLRPVIVASTASTQPVQPAPAAPPSSTAFAVAPMTAPTAAAATVTAPVTAAPTQPERARSDPLSPLSISEAVAATEPPPPQTIQQSEPPAPKP